MQLKLALGDLRGSMLRGEKFADCAVCRTGLIGLESVAGVGDQYEFGSWKALGDQLGTRGRNEPIGFGVNDERRSGETSTALYVLSRPRVKETVCRPI
jgi:hypothetical protein